MASSLSIDEESQFLDYLADHFPPDVRTRDYELSKNSAGNARLLIDNQIRKIRQEREASSSDHYDKPGSYCSRDSSNPVAASLDAAAKALSLSEPYDEGPSLTPSTLSSEEAYVRGYGRADHQSELHAFPRDEEEESFHAIGEIMLNGSFISQQQQQQQHTGSSGQSQTPRKDLISKTPSRSPHSVSEW